MPLEQHCATELSVTISNVLCTVGERDTRSTGGGPCFWDLRTFLGQAVNVTIKMTQKFIGIALGIRDIPLNSGKVIINKDNKIPVLVPLLVTIRWDNVSQSLNKYGCASCVPRMKQVQSGLEDTSRVPALAGGSALLRLLLACLFIQTRLLPEVQKAMASVDGQMGSAVQGLKAPRLQPRLCTLVNYQPPSRLDFIISTMTVLIPVILRLSSA